MNDLRACLQEYGRSIINSTMDHTAGEALRLEHGIKTAKEKVMAHYERQEETIDRLNVDLKVADESIRLLHKMIQTLKMLQVNLNADLKLKIRITNEVREEVRSSDPQGERGPEIVEE